MSLREWMLALALVAAAGCVTTGIALLAVSAAWIVGGILLAAIAYLVLAEDTAAPEADE